jgi:hypothetical protein
MIKGKGTEIVNDMSSELLLKHKAYVRITSLHMHLEQYLRTPNTELWYPKRTDSSTVTDTSWEEPTQAIGYMPIHPSIWQLKWGIYLRMAPRWSQVAAVAATFSCRLRQHRGSRTWHTSLSSWSGRRGGPIRMTHGVAAVLVRGASKSTALVARAAQLSVSPYTLNR